MLCDKEVIRLNVRPTNIGAENEGQPTKNQRCAPLRPLSHVHSTTLTVSAHQAPNGRFIHRPLVVIVRFRRHFLNPIDLSRVKELEKLFFRHATFKQRNKRGRSSWGSFAQSEADVQGVLNQSYLCSRRPGALLPVQRDAPRRHQLAPLAPPALRRGAILSRLGNQTVLGCKHPWSGMVFGMGYHF